MHPSIHLGDREIDRQHEELFDAFLQLEALGDAAFPEERLSELLSALGDKMQRHFAIEETLMAALHLPEALRREHCCAHLQILEDFAQLHLDAMRGCRWPLQDIVIRVRQWVVRHLIEEDLQLKPFLARQGDRTATA